MVTTVPGPKSQELIGRLGYIQNTMATQFFVDYKNSHGNYIRDVDGNNILDLFNQISSVSLGYNHPRFAETVQNPENLHQFINRPALGFFPGEDWVDRLENSLLSVAPKGLNRVVTMACGSCSNENAFKSVFMAYKRYLRGGTDYTEEEKRTCVMNVAPGAPPLSILSFQNGLHGRTMACSSATHTKWPYKMDFPHMDWPTADWPELKYPLEEFVDENRAEEDRCLEKVNSLMEEFKSKDEDVAAIIAEPIQSEGGDHYSTPYFFQGLQKLCKKHHSYFIVDEVQTGGGSTGMMWYHESFDLPQPPDIVVFSKKAITGGFYFTDELMPREGGRVFNTWMGDPSKVLLMETMVNVIKEENLLNNCKVTGEYLGKGMHQLEMKFPDQINKVRGPGVFKAVDVKTPEHRDKIMRQLRDRGVLVGGCGDRTIRLRPSLILQEHHADIFLDIFEGVLTDNQ
ncbi:hypothetical protein CAPTEDRAFT_205968 [Capitella teleta]|uniref:(S)-3-amino-2-methylpropionate transaminase n=1 Tax=Capitella teleta TaxID=283909 RepID=R7TCF7_CAPTE|nr:hypothetical protein CAPTEDRAFT_205968 [Capitella teleta]|eukprot:ELT91408.1 hypothetical protein CAPTEDRAFT_205968 [Capitella teleta]